MPERTIYIPQGAPPPADPRVSEIYAKMGEENIYLMMEDFYKELERSSIRSLFPENMKEASAKSADFFVFLLGGPPLYHQKHGPPMMRKRHLPFVIDEKARKVWIDCFKKTLEHGEKYAFPIEYKDSFLNFLEKFSKWMVNTQ